MKKFFTLLSFFVLILLPLVYSFEMEPPDKTVHQHLTNESKLVWNLVSPETRGHLLQPIDDDEIDGNYVKAPVSQRSYRGISSTAYAFYKNPGPYR